MFCIWGSGLCNCLDYFCLSGGGLVYLLASEATSLCLKEALSSQWGPRSWSSPSEHPRPHPVWSTCCLLLGCLPASGKLKCCHTLSFSATVTVGRTPRAFGDIISMLKSNLKCFLKILLRPPDVRGTKLCHRKRVGNRFCQPAVQIMQCLVLLKHGFV